ncbi:MAG: hypothetical protein HC907_22125 [Richelia sp. SM1_7_0]|nr:hypothetical protein [Richelia sp. SM1_7_0]
MLDLIKNFLDVDNGTDSTEPQTILEQIEQKNPNNVTERHLLLSEDDTEKQIELLETLRGFAVSTTLNAFITLTVLEAVKSVTLTFNPFTFFIISTGLNLAVSAASSDKNKKPITNLSIGVGKFAINLVVNGSLINNLNEKVGESKIIVEGIKQEIQNYEAGYKDNSGFDMMLAAPIIAIIIFLAIRVFTRR